MTFVFHEMHEAVGAWMLAYPTFDWLCMVWRPSPLVGYTIRYRLRLYDPHDPDPWAGVDTRRWYEAVTPATTTRAEVLAQVRRLVTELVTRHTQRAIDTDAVVVEGDGRALLQALNGRSWFQGKTGADYEAWQRAYDADQLPAQRRRATRLKGRRPPRRAR
jgi:hypothetical protein